MGVASATYGAGALVLQIGDERNSLRAERIVCVESCTMADLALQDDSAFHLLVTDDQFWLLGPEVDGGLGAVADLVREHPGLPVVRTIVHALPWSMRHGGLLGLRLMQTPGAGRFPISELRRLERQQVTA